MKPNLFLALCIDYPVSSIEPFLVSLRNHVPNSDIVLFASGMKGNFEETAETFNIQTINPGRYFSNGYHAFISRFFMYEDFLEQHRGRYENIFLTDIRDVLFQGNPFAMNRSADVCFAAEDGTIASSHYNRTWLNEIYGEALTAEIGYFPISCAGTTFGSAEGITQYLHAMTSEMRGRDYNHQVNYDQGMHNYIVWKQRPVFGCVDMPRRILFTVGLTKRENITLEQERIFVDGLLAPVVHQWDRHAMLKELVEHAPQFTLSGLRKN